MTTTNRRLTSVLLSLLLVIGGPTLAATEMAGGQPESAMTDCGSMGMDRADCITASEMVCLGAGGLGQCGTSPAILLAGPEAFTDTGSQPVFNARVTIYQAPFLEFITPPPRHRS